VVVYNSSTRFELSSYFAIIGHFSLVDLKSLQVLQLTHLIPSILFAQGPIYVSASASRSDKLQSTFVDMAVCCKWNHRFV
jgi:hypothetical protein